jgi:hypothetical protein
MVDADFAKFVRDPEQAFDDLPTLERAGPEDRRVVLPRMSDADAGLPIDHLIERRPAVDTLLAYGRFVLARPQPQIRCLYSAWNPLDGGTFANLVGLRAASFGAAARGVDLEWLTPELEHLGGFSGSFDDFLVVGRFEGLRTLRIDDPAPPAIKPISGLKQLRRLSLGSRLFGVSNRGERLGTASALGRLEELEEVELIGLTAKDLRAFCGWTRVRRLGLRTRGQLDGIEAMTALEEVNIDGFFMRGPCPAIAPLAALPHLTRLNLSEYQHPPSDVDRLGQLHALRSLRLTLKGDPPQLPTARMLVTLENLEALELGLSVGDGQISVLGALPRLERLVIGGTYHPREVETLRQALPHCQLEVDAWTEPPEEPDWRQAGALRYCLTPEGTWDVFQDLSAALNTEGNHVAEHLIQRTLAKEAPALLARLAFDTEADYFSVQAQAESDLLELAEVIDRLRARRVKK